MDTTKNAHLTVSVAVGAVWVGRPHAAITRDKYRIFAFHKLNHSS
jgi:hypothetical protein